MGCQIQSCAVLWLEFNTPASEAGICVLKCTRLNIATNVLEFYAYKALSNPTDSSSTQVTCCHILLRTPNGLTNV